VDRLTSLTAGFLPFAYAEIENAGAALGDLAQQLHRASPVSTMTHFLSACPAGDLDDAEAA
jgi:hypothetical protein